MQLESKVSHCRPQGALWHVGWTGSHLLHKTPRGTKHPSLGVSHQWSQENTEFCTRKEKHGGPQHLCLLLSVLLDPAQRFISLFGGKKSYSLEGLGLGAQITWQLTCVSRRQDLEAE
jgi:hypothetical protein